MSYILQALKKSEQERQQGDIPDLNSHHGVVELDEYPVASVARGRWFWVYLLLFILGMILGGCLLFLSWQRPVVSAATAQKSVIVPVAPAVVEEPEMHVAEPVVEPAVVEVPVKRPTAVAIMPLPTQTVAEPVTNTDNKAAQPTKVNVTTAVSTVTAQTKPATATSAVKAAEPVPYLTELDDAFQQQVPTLRFSTHIYTPKARLRIVEINGQRYAENAMIAPGLRLLHITPKGVVLQLKGQSFQLDANRNWLKD